MGKTVCRDHKDNDHVLKLITIETKTLQAPVLSCILESSGLPGLEGKVVLVTGANTGRTKTSVHQQPANYLLFVKKASPNNQKTTKVPTDKHPGIGYHTALAVASRGGRLVMGCRDAQKGQVSRSLSEFARV